MVVRYVAEGGASCGRRGKSASLLRDFEFNRTVAALWREFDGIFSDETIARFVRESFDRWPSPKIALTSRCSHTGSLGSGSVRSARPKGPS